MNEAITMSDWTEHENLFADVIIKIIESKHRGYERQHKELEADPVPLANISICPKDFGDVPNIMPGMKLGRKHGLTVQGMLRLFWEKVN